MLPITVIPELLPQLTLWPHDPIQPDEEGGEGLSLAFGWICLVFGYKLKMDGNYIQATPRDVPERKGGGKI